MTDHELMMIVDDIFAYAVEIDASDIHLSSGYPPMWRANGVLTYGSSSRLTSSEVEECLSSLLTADECTRFQAGSDIDGAITRREGRFRLHVFRHLHGPALSIRRLPQKVPSCDELRLPPVVKEFTLRASGLIVVAGATGSGKTTTAAAMVASIAKREPCHIITIEDPIEVLHASYRALVSQREVGTHAPSFRDALRSALREDPDVIFVGEMRDVETIELALRAAETGHLVVSTLHTSSAAKSVERIIDVFSGDQQRQARCALAETLIGVVHQELVPCVGGGRIGVYEVLVATPAVRALIREGRAHQIDAVIQTAAREGMVSREMAWRRLVDEGRVLNEIGKCPGYGKPRGQHV